MHLTPEILLNAYANGYFPMADSTTATELDWYSPDPRAILPLDAVHFSKRLLRTYRSGKFDIHIDKNFANVMRACADLRSDSWINAEIFAVYNQLHALGHAHSVESWQDGQLVGGLYGVSLGGAFFGESMFSTVTDASKVALVALVERLKSQGFLLLDVQFQTEHLRSFGVIEVLRKDYVKKLNIALQQKIGFV